MSTSSSPTIKPCTWESNFAWPIAETSTHWIILGLDKDLNVAMSLAARNAINFLAAAPASPSSTPTRYAASRSVSA
jgi:acetamidase/formamidase